MDYIGRMCTCSARRHEELMQLDDDSVHARDSTRQADRSSQGGGAVAQADGWLNVTRNEVLAENWVIVHGHRGDVQSSRGSAVTTYDTV